MPVYQRTITVNNIKRNYTVYKPVGLAWGSPVMLLFHGGGGGDYAATLLQTGFSAIADKYQFLLVLPQGTGANERIANNRSWNAGNCCGYAEQNNIDDVAFISALIDAVVLEFKVNARRVYSSGISNGGMMCHKLAHDIPNKITAIGSVESGLGMNPKSLSTTTRGVPVIMFHGGKDLNYPLNGGIGPNSVSKTWFYSVLDTVQYWVRNNKCGQPQKVTLKDYELTVYPASGSQAAVNFYYLPENGHTWPGGTDTTKDLGTGPLVATVPASESIWQFVQQYSL